MSDQRPAKAAIAFLSSEDTAFDTNSARTNAAISRFERGIPHQHVSCAFGSIANPGYYYHYYLIASRIPPGHIHWVVGGWVVFSVLAVFSFYQPNRSTNSTKSPTNYPTQPTKQTKQTNQPNQPTNQTMWETNAKIRNRPHFFSK